MLVPIIFCDACILYPAPIRDLLMECALNDLVQLKWSHKVLDEWIDNLLKNRPDLSRERLEITKTGMIFAILDSVVEHYESIERDLILPDENDKHVLAAAIKSKSAFIVTANLRDFPNEYLSKFKMKSCHPDDLFIMLAQGNKKGFLDSVRACHQKLKKPPLLWEQYISNLRSKCGLLKTTEFIKLNE